MFGTLKIGAVTLMVMVRVSGTSGSTACCDAVQRRAVQVTTPPAWLQVNAPGQPAAPCPRPRGTSTPAGSTSRDRDVQRRRLARRSSPSGCR